MSKPNASITNAPDGLVIDGIKFPGDVRVDSDRPVTYRGCTFAGRLVMGGADS